jgi:hypothetical protein
MKRSLKTTSRLDQLDREILDLTTKQLGCPFKDFEPLHLEIMAKQLERRNLAKTDRTAVPAEDPAIA